MNLSLRTRIAAEFLGTAFLVAAIVGSGIMAERLSGGNMSAALLAHSTATGLALMALIIAFGPVSGAHLNPVVSFASALERGLSWVEMFAYALAQCSGGIAGTMAANAMYELPLVSLSRHVRSGPSQFLSECIATFGLLLIIGICSRYRAPLTAVAVGGYIGAACWFTASTSFTNPAVTISRSLTDTFSGIRPKDIFPFVAAQFLAGTLAAGVLRLFTLRSSRGPADCG